MAKKILLIDDNPADRRLAEHLLRGSFKDWRLEGVGDALGFQRAMADGMPDAVVCEAVLHWARGVDLALTLKAANPWLPIIFFCSPLAAGREEELLTVQPADLLVKSSLTYLQLPKLLLSAMRRAELFRRQLPAQDSANFLAGFDLGWFQYDPERSQLLVNRVLADWIGKPAPLVGLGDLPEPLLCRLDPEQLRRLPEAERRSARQVEVEWGNRRHGVQISESVEISADRLLVSGVVQDLGSQAEQQKRLEQSNEDLQNFALLAAHQLKEPLRMVERFTDILLDEYSAKLDDQAGDYLRFASDGASRMSRLVDDLLSFARVEAEPQDFQTLESEDLVREAIANLRISLEESKGEVGTGDLPQVFGDRSQLVQVFQNLIENALKFRHPDRPPRIRISAEQNARQIQFRVEDNGLGFPSEQADVIFESFRRLHSKLPGSGMGLAITRRIIERHGGRIWAVSQPGQGSTFQFTLPCQPGEIG